MTEEFKPYIGAGFFEEKDKDIFFGREREKNDLLSLIFAHQAVLIYAQSGAGKTSLINAALIPMLKDEGFEVFPPARVRKPILENIHPDEIENVYVFNALISWTKEEPDLKRLIKMSLPDFFRERKRLKDKEGEPRPRVLIFDQFEELFTSYQKYWGKREGFFKQVKDALDGDPILRVAFAIREEHLARLDSYAHLLPEKLRTRFHLELLREGAAREAITKPPEKAGCSFDNGVAENLVEELMKTNVEDAAGNLVEAKGEFVEPVQLQVVCEALWSSLPKGVTLIEQSHLDRAFGGTNKERRDFVGQALIKFYERAIKETVEKTGAREEDIRSWFGDKLITSMETRGAVQDTSGLPNEAVEMLDRDHHLIRAVELRPGVRFYELIHDRLIKPIKESNSQYKKDAITQYMDVVRSGEKRVYDKAKQADKTIADKATLAGAKYNLTYADKGPVQPDGYDEALSALDKAINVSPKDPWAYNERGNVYFDYGDYEKAIAEYDQAIRLDPNYKWAYRNKGYALYKIGRYDEALVALNKTIEIDPNYADPYNDRGNVYLDRGEYEKAIAEYDRAIQIDRNYKWAHANKGYALRKLGRYEEALTALDRAVELDPNYIDAYNNRGNIYSDLEQYERAIAEYDNVIRIDPRYIPAYANKAYALGKLGRRGEAFAVLNRTIELDPKYVWAYNERGNAYLDLGDYEKAIVDYDNAIKVDPNYKWAYRNKGYALYKLGHYDEALVALDKTISIDPKYVDPYNDRGNVYLDRGDYEKAIAEYNRAIELDPNYKWAYRNKGYALYKLGHYDEALIALDKAINIDPKYPDPYNDRGNVYLDRGEYGKAIAEYDKAIKLDPSYEWAYANKGYALRKLGRYEETLAALDKAIEINPEYESVRGTKGEVLLQLGRYGEAVREFDRTIETYNKLIKKNPNEASYYGSIGWYYYLENRYDESIQASQKAVSFDPKEPTTQFNLGLAYLALGKNELSREAYKVGIEKANALSGNGQIHIENAIDDLKQLISKKPEVEAEVKEIIQLLRKAKEKNLKI